MDMLGVLKKGLLALSLLAGVQVMAMESDPRQLEAQLLSLAERMIESRWQFLARKIDYCDQLFKDSLDDEERKSRKKILTMWRNEWEGLEGWVQKEGKITVGRFLAQQLIENRTKNQTFFRD
jgi:hypothetical protein